MTQQLTVSSPTVLLLAFHSYAGMGPYVVSIVNSFKPCDNIRFFLIEGPDRYYHDNIRPDLLDKGLIKTDTHVNKFRTLIETIWRERSPYRKEIIKYCNEEGISIIHDLTGCTDNGLIKSLDRHFTLLFTVHDLFPHEVKKSFFKEWRIKSIYKRLFKSIRSSSSLITNSLEQMTLQKEKYPEKNHFYAKFPTLITPNIAGGRESVPELKGEKGYILFFGRIEAYKGVENLIDAFISANLPQDVKLVIAGKGELGYSQSDSRIVTINRYIDDKEIAALYRNAAVVVYPYLSATQSGVLSVSTFFRTPTIASDVTFFKEILGDDYTLLFKAGDCKALSHILENLFSLNHQQLSAIKTLMHHIYETVYSDTAQRERLLEIYSTLEKNNP
ncbi:MAG: glycosyltransferase [Muribaculaceae bacterium]|nr:glycosyltransferase [Muribaculaceae bacterium]